MLLNCEKGSDTTTERGIGDGGDNDSYYIPESDSEGTGTTEQIVIPPVTGDEESHFIKERHNPSISDECNISDRNNDSDNISKSDSEGTGTTEQIVIPPATGDEESHCIKERLDPSISDECNISDRDNSDNIPESDSEGTRTTEQIVISPATGDEESHCIKERHDPSISDECNISDRDNDSDKIPESDLEGTRTTEKIVMPPATGDEESHFIKERHDPSISDECNISDRNNDSDNISESDSEGTGTTGQIVIPPATGDEESHCIKERLDPNISDECNISDRDNSDKIPESDLEGTRTTEQIVIPPATGDEERHDPSISDECNISDRDNDSDKIPESDSERTRTTEQIVMPPATGDEESHCIKESRDPRNSDECNISDSDNDSYNIPESDSKGTGTTEQIVIPPGTGDEESQFIKERHDPRNSDECNISDTDNDSDYILESDWEGSRTTEQIVIPPATGDEESHCIKESRDPCSSDECNISDSDNDSDYIPESDSEGTRTTEQMVTSGQERQSMPFRTQRRDSDEDMYFNLYPWKKRHHRREDGRPVTVTSFMKMKEPEGELEGLKGQSKLWIGKDYVNFIHKDPVDVRNPFEDFIKRDETPRMPWHDIASVVYGKAARDVARHFIRRWNFCKTEKFKKNKKYPLLMPKSYAKCDVSPAIKDITYQVKSQNQFFITQIADKSQVKNGVGEALLKRIEKAYRENETFRVFVVLPLLPAFEGEIGENGGYAIQAVLHWNYKSISKGPHSLWHHLNKRVDDPKKYVVFCGLRTHAELKGRLVTELVYVHSKLMIIDDDTVIIGSANINDRSLLGNRDSEVCVMYEDMQKFPVKMAGKDHMAGNFAASIRRTLFQEHLGIEEHDDEIDLSDPIGDQFWKNVWFRQATINTTLYFKVFNCVPDDHIKSFDQLKQITSQKTLAETDPDTARSELQKIKGRLVFLPLYFLEEQESIIPVGANKESVMPVKLWT